MSELEHARALFAMAGKDLRALQGMGDATIFADEIFGFHAQQCVEKAHKAWIAALGMEYPLTHNLARLLAILEDRGAKVEDFWDLAEYSCLGRRVPLRSFGCGRGREALNRPLIVGKVQKLVSQIQKLILTKGDTD